MQVLEHHKMVYQGHNAGGAGGYDGPTHQGINTAYFDKGDDKSPFEHYKDNQYDKKDDNSSGGDYNKKEEEQKKGKEDKHKEGKHKDTLMDAVEKEEKKTKKQEEQNYPKTAAKEIMHNQNGVNNNQDKKPKDTKAHKSIEEAIKYASKDKKEAFVLE